VDCTAEIPRLGYSVGNAVRLDDRTGEGIGTDCAAETEFNHCCSKKTLETDGVIGALLLLVNCEDIGEW
jgi:hypothetical protein